MQDLKQIPEPSQKMVMGPAFMMQTQMQQNNFVGQLTRSNLDSVSKDNNTAP